MAKKWKDPLYGAVLYGQSGGPSAVINASAYGVIKTALESVHVTKVYAAENGILGILDERLMVMNKEDPEELERLLHTPSSAFGSCRYKIAAPEDDETDYKRILDIFESYNIRYFFYNGGNDSMDTCNKISRYLKKKRYDCHIIGVPKTIDNDLYGTDHCPGFASAAKYIATSIMEASRDSHVYNTGLITIIECMGRHAGWLTAAAVLASENCDGPDLIYLPEVDFDMQDFLDDVIRVYEGKGSCMVAVSEGIHYADGTFVSEAKTSATDGFGHAQLGGLAAKLTAIVRAATGAKVRGIELSLLQRCAAHCASQTDIDEAFRAGEFAVESAIAGESGKMVGFSCSRRNGYTCKLVLVNLEDVANEEKKIPLSWITSDNSFVGEKFVQYCRPLLAGEPQRETVDGLPRFAKLKKVFTR
ncbi:MAG: 6-phosphofructokinase [Oscillospiraceae bacterium]|jgi:6-phosphofructokinase 1|nr:6-phosphofructokinase [Oscillospiraceae bacterium]